MKLTIVLKEPSEKYDLSGRVGYQLVNDTDPMMLRFWGYLDEDAEDLTMLIPADRLVNLRMGQ